MRKFRIEPHFGEELTFADLSFPIPSCMLSVSIRRIEDKLTCKVSAPADVEIEFADDASISFKRV